MDCAVVEYASVLGCIANEEPGCVEQIGGLGAYEEWLADIAFLDLEFGGAVGGVEAARVTCHYFQVRVLFGEGADGAGLETSLISLGTLGS